MCIWPQYCTYVWNRVKLDRHIKLKIKENKKRNWKINILASNKWNNSIKSKYKW